MKLWDTKKHGYSFLLELDYKKCMEECNMLYKVIKGLPTTELVYNMKATCATIKKMARALTLEIIV